MFLFYVHTTKLFQERGHYSRGDINQERTLFKEIRKYLKYRSCFSDSFATFLQNHFRDLALFDKTNAKHQT
jgi:hypothetical protein